MGLSRDEASSKGEDYSSNEESVEYDGRIHRISPCFTFSSYEEKKDKMLPVLSEWLKSTPKIKDIKRDLDTVTLLRAEKLSQTVAMNHKPHVSTVWQIKNYTKTLSIGLKAIALNIIRGSSTS